MSNPVPGPEPELGGTFVEGTVDPDYYLNLVLILFQILGTDIDPDSEPGPDLDPESCPDPVPGAHPGWSCVMQQLVRLSDCVSRVSLALQGLFINSVSFFTLTHRGSCYTATHSVNEAQDH